MAPPCPLSKICLKLPLVGSSGSFRRSRHFIFSFSIQHTIPPTRESPYYNMVVQMSVCHFFSAIGPLLTSGQALWDNALYNWIVCSSFSGPIGKAIGVYISPHIQIT